MRIPSRFMKTIAHEAPSKFEDADQLSYVGAVALAAGPIEDRRLNAYVRYFKAEQEQDRAQMEHWRAQSARAAELHEVHELIRGRMLLLTSALSVKEMKEWQAGAAERLPQEMLGYVNFLAGVGCLQSGDSEEASIFLLKSAAEYGRAGKHSRELQSLLQDPELSEAEIRFLRACALRDGDLKSFHVGALSLASAALREGDIETVRGFGRESVRAFRDEFLDPRRERIGLKILSAAEGSHRDLTRLEQRVWQKLKTGACSKKELIREVYGSETRRIPNDSIDVRFRTLISRLNRKMNGRITNHKGIYSLNS